MSNPTTTTALQGTSLLHITTTTTSNTTNGGSCTSPLDNIHFSSSQLLSLLDSKDEAFQVLKSDLMDALNNEVKSLDEDSWMFEGPRSRISLISKPDALFCGGGDRVLLTSSNEAAYPGTSIP